jgi:adenosylhomocysteine nucleosidase
MTLLAVVGLIREARLVAAPGVHVVVGGARSDLLAERLRTALAAGANGVISIGIGGALAPGLNVGDAVIGDAVIGDAVIGAGERRETDSAWTARLAAALPQALVAPIWGAEAMVLDAREKARLYAAAGAAVVDMESQVVARLASEHGLPFAVLRVISDTARTDLPPAVLAGMRPDGGMNLAGVLGALARRPQQLPALIRLGRDVDRAFKALAKAHAAAGPGLALSA